MHIVVIGAGLTGANAVEELRTQGYTGDITLVGAETHLPYERPPLSKGVLLGNEEPDSVFVHDAAWYADQAVDLRLGTPAGEIDLDRRHVVVDEQRLSYDRLLLATGALPRRLPHVETAHPEVAYLRTLDDALAIKARLAGHVLIIGGGWIGLEVAAAARHAGARVTVVEAARLPLLSVLGPEVAELFAGLHRENGVDLRLNSSLDSVDSTRAGAVTARLSDGSELNADLVVVGIGVLPCDELARRAGLPVDNGVLVDARLRTHDPHVYAAGDVANHAHPRLGRRVRVEHWDTAIQQGRHAARVMLGDDEPYTRFPYFFTDQYDVGMEYVGSVGPEGYDQVVIRGDSGKRIFNALWILQGRVVAGMHVNDWDSIDSLRALVGRKAPPRLADLDVPLAELAGDPPPGSETY